MPNLTRVSQMELTAALNGNTAVSDALGNVMNGSAMNSFTPTASSGSTVGVYASIGTRIYVEITLVLPAAGHPTVALPFTHQSLSSQHGVIPGLSAAGIAINGMVPSGSSVMTLYRYDGAPLDAGTYYIAGTYESDIG